MVFEEFSSGVFLILILLIIPYSIILWLISRLFKFEKQDFKYGFYVSVASFFIGLILAFLNSLANVLSSIPPSFSYLVFLLIDIPLIKYGYSENWTKSLLAALIWGVLKIIVAGIVVLIGAVILSILGIGN
jgi:hypothetical protein